MSAFIFLFVCLLGGVVVKRFAPVPATLSSSLNWWVMNIALPALVLELIPPIRFDWSIWFLPVSEWAAFAVTVAVFGAVSRAAGWSRPRTGALILAAGLGNTAFMGYPMNEALRGRDGLAYAVVADQLGSFVMLGIGGILIASIYSGKRAVAREIVRRIVFFPPFIALVVAFVIGAVGQMPPLVLDVVHRLGLTLTPLALFSVGLQFHFTLQRDELQALAVGLLWKLVLLPLAFVGVAALFSVHGLVRDVSILQLAMGPMISSVILADAYGLEAKLSNSILATGLTLSLVTVPAWNYVLQQVF